VKQRLYVYAIMPVSSDPQFETKRAVLSAVADGFGIDAHFPLDHLSHHAADFDLDEVLGALTGSIGVIADLSLERPSCYYELGLAQALGVRVALIAETGTVIHQAHNRAEVAAYTAGDSYRDLVVRCLSQLLNQYRQYV
jgi:hypothetical protein